MKICQIGKLFTTFIFAFLLSFSFLIPSFCAAHPLNNSYSLVTIGDEEIAYELFMPEMAMLLFDADGDGKVTWNEVDGQREQEEAYLRSRLLLTNEDMPMDMTMVSVKPEQKEYAGFTFALTFSSDRPIRDLMIQYNLLFDDLDRTHLSQLLLSDSGNLEQAIMQDADRTFHYVSNQPHSAWEALRGYLLLGIEHIWSGTDHLLFLLTLLLIVTRVKDAIWIVTAFTVAHSITLFLAASEWVHFDPRWIEAAIALSIGYVAIENVFGQSLKARWLITFGFGLIHGLGFAGALADIGLPPAYFLRSLLSFNLGVEVGQLAVVAVSLPLFLYIRTKKWHLIFLRGASVCVLLVSLFWFAERIGLL